jgi:rRNA maturation RNase YbeY
MPVPSNKIKFHYLINDFTFRHRGKLKLFIEHIAKQEKYSLASINFIFCSDDYLLNYNKQYLNHSTLTDIITFQFNNKAEPIFGEVYLSIDRIKENAKKFSTLFKYELHRVIIHGALHLCGYKDKTKKEKIIMRERENFYLNIYFISRETF